MESDFSIGDRVKIKNLTWNPNESLMPGDLGTVVCANGKWSVGVCWDKKFRRGHTCDGACERHHGWYVNNSEIELATCSIELDVGGYL